MAKRKRIRKPRSVEPRPGFPREGILKTKEEVDAYFAADKIQCLLCGRWFKSLGNKHLRNGHGTTAEDYKEKYGLPFHRGLDGKSTRRIRIELGRQAWLDGRFEEIHKAFDPSKLAGPKRHQPFQRDLASRLGLARRGKNWKFRRKDSETVLERLRKKQRLPSDKDPNRPSLRKTKEYLNKNPDFAEKYKQTCHRLPYSLQIRAKHLSPRFQIDCQRLRAGGMSLEKIAAALGVSASFIRKELGNMPGGFRLLDKKPTVKWRLKDHEAILERVRRQQRKLKDVCNDPDLPSYSTWLLFRKSHPELVEKHRRIIFSQPYHVQLKGKVLSPQLFIDLQRMHSRGMTYKEIATEIGATLNVVVRVFRIINKDARTTSKKR